MRAKKRAEWAADAAPRVVAQLLEPAGRREARFERLLHASLWGNRTDLSYMVAAHLGARPRRCRAQQPAGG